MTAFNKADSGKPRIDTPAGTRTTQNLCVEAGEQLPTALFSGEGCKCTYGNSYVRDGTINLTLSCVNEKLNEAMMMMAVDGTFEGGSVTFNRSLRSAFATAGGAVIDSKISGKRTGDCEAPAEGKAAPKG